MFTVSAMRHVRRALLFTTIAAGLSGCGVDKQSAPTLIGPSELGLSLTLSATPDQVVRDGSSRSVVTVVARDSQNRPVAGQLLTLSTNVGSLTRRQVVTGSDGRATFDFIAPTLNTPVPGNVAIVGATPVGSNFDNATMRTVSIALTPANSTAPDPSFTVNPETPRRDQVVTFDASATTDEGVPCGETCRYVWDFGGEASASGRVVSYQFKNPQQYIVNLTVTDSSGTTASLRRTVSVTPSVAPTAQISYSPRPPAPGETVRFSAAASTAANGATIVEYLWNFGNGQTATGVMATTTFPLERTYDVQLTVRDSNGSTATATQAVAVEVP